MKEATKGVLSEKNPYYIPKYRYYELKYFCMQYPEWEKQYNNCTFLLSKYFENDVVSNSEVSDPTSKLYFKQSETKHRMDFIDNILHEEFIKKYNKPIELLEPIKYAVTHGKGWTVVQARYSLFCTREQYYDFYHWFFYMLNRVKI